MNRKAAAIAAALLAVPAFFALRSAFLKTRAAAEVQETVGSIDEEQRRRLREAVENGYASTVAAFATSGENADYEARDARAEQDAERLQQTFSAVRSDLAPELASACEAMVERVASAQLQLMAFAINRKHRGLPDGAQAEAEIDDRKAFTREIEPLYERLKASLS